MGSILVVSGPSGSGKTSLAREVVDVSNNAYFSISTTTRAPRNGEENGYDYFFISKEEFLKQIEENQFLEWAEVHGNYYGTSLKPINDALNEGKLVVFDIDVQGHRLLRQKYGNSITSVFITTPTLEILKSRLLGRESENTQQVEKRLNNALEEMQYINEYDFFLINDTFDASLLALSAIAESARFKCSKYNLEEFFNTWKKN